MKSILLYNHSGCKNRGCEAIVRSTAALFAPYASICLASREAQTDRQLGLRDVSEIVPMTISPYSIHRFINSVGSRMGISAQAEMARKYHTTIAMGKRCAIALSIGGDTYCYGPQRHMLVINERLHHAGCRLVLWGCSVEPDLLQGDCLRDLKQYDLIVARESITAHAMQEAGLPVMQWCDPAFTLQSEYLPLPQAWREGNTVGINMSPLALNCAKDGKKTLDAFIQLVEHMLHSSDAAVALVPHVMWAHDNDLDALGRIKAHFENEERVFLLPSTLNAMQYKGYIARLRALITARTHASIAAYSSGVPTLVVGYSVKAKGIANDLYGTQEGHLIPVQELEDAHQLISQADALMAREMQERAFLLKRVPVYMEGQEQTIEAVLSLMNTKEKP